LKRGDVILVAAAGEFGKPRPAVILQADLSMADETITFVPITSDLERFPLIRISIEPNHRAHRSQDNAPS
jgi:mRNA interferase MazF